MIVFAGNEEKHYLCRLKFFSLLGMYISEEELLNHIAAKPFRLVSEAADEMGVEAYVIGGYVRDIFLNRPSKDIDIVAVGSGIELAKRVAEKLGKHCRYSRTSERHR